jgi:hypothetical protein
MSLKMNYIQLTFGIWLYRKLLCVALFYTHLELANGRSLKIYKNQVIFEPMTKC